MTVKSDVEYLNCLLKPTSTLKNFKATSILKSTVLLFLINPPFPWENFKSASYFDDSYLYIPTQESIYNII